MLLEMMSELLRMMAAGNYMARMLRQSFKVHERFAGSWRQSVACAAASWQLSGSLGRLPGNESRFKVKKL